MTKFKISPYFKILLTFVAVILIGTIFLILPISSTGKSLSFLDALFMATSSVCVTGLSVVKNLATDFTFFGQFVILILMIVGGLGFLTFTTFFFVIIGSKIGITDRFLMKETLNLDTTKGVIKYVKNIVLFALGIQFFGTIINYFILIKPYGAVKAIWVSIFHSVSSFNNAGFDIFGNGNSMISLNNNVLLNISTMLLVIIGGMGFVTIFDVIKNKRWQKLSLTTKSVIIMVPVLILIGFIFIKLCSYGKISWLQALFLSVSTRTAGFTSVDLNNLSNASYILVLGLMFIGGSPCSTAGGIKTTTLFVLIVTMFKYTIGKKPTVFKRRISDQTIMKAFSLFLLSVMYIMLATLILSLVQNGFRIKELLFEVVSAFGTVGLSLGLTSSLSVGGKIIIILTMFIGRLGPLSIMNTMNKHWLQNDLETIDYVEEKMIVG